MSGNIGQQLSHLIQKQLMAKPTIRVPIVVMDVTSGQQHMIHKNMSLVFIGINRSQTTITIISSNGRGFSTKLLPPAKVDNPSAPTYPFWNLKIRMGTTWQLEILPR
jgi:hypothetical protein